MKKRSRHTKQPSWIAAGKDKPVLPERTLMITIRASEDSCCSWWPDPKKRCPHIATNMMGSNYLCGLFGRNLVEGIDKRLRRVPECIKAEVDGEVGTVSKAVAKKRVVKKENR